MKLDRIHTSIPLFDATSLSVWKDKYCWGSEKTPEDSLERVSHGVYADDAPHRKEALSYMKAGLWIPAGRIHAGAGTTKRVTQINCYVLQTIEDSMEGIANALKDSMLTMQQGGGIGMDFSTLRPHGAILERTGSIASGPLSFMNMWHSMCGTIMSAGSRRGAMMAVLRCDHPDIIAFIKAKQEKGALTNFNLSVAITNKFMQALKEADSTWDLGFSVPPKNETPLEILERNGKPWYVYTRIRTSELWDTLLRATYEYSEPGIVFIDRINEKNNLSYCEEIFATNPCFAPGTLITTRNGIFPIEDLVGKSVELWNGKEWERTDSFRVTGENQEIHEIELYDGSKIKVTPYHNMFLSNGTKVKAKDLKLGQELWLSLAEPSYGTEAKGAYLKGFLLGDGWVTDGGNPGLEIRKGQELCKERLVSSLFQLISEETDATEKPYLHYIGGLRNSRCFLRGMNPRKGELLKYIQEGKSGIPREVLTWNMKGCLQFIAGYFDADGTAPDTDNGFSYQIASKHREVLQDLQILLKSVGIPSKIGIGTAADVKYSYIGRRLSKKTWRLFITQSYSIKLAKNIEFSRLKSFANKTIKNVVQNKATKIVAIRSKGKSEKVYCCTLTSHKLQIASGILTGQCGEQPLPPNGACNLGSVNLARMVYSPFSKNAHMSMELLKKTVQVGVRFLDNVLDTTKYPLEAQKAEAQEKRRIGLGITGLANALAMLGYEYGDLASVGYTKLLMETVRNAAYTASIRLAKERGAFPSYDKKAYAKNPFIRALPSRIQKELALNGIRNGVLLTIAPTGTTSLYFGNISSGIEPPFALETERNILQPDNTYKAFSVKDYSLKVFEAVHGKEKDPKEHIKIATELDVASHLSILAACQARVDSSISKTINCSEDLPYEEFKAIYESAYNKGCKGCTTYRPSAMRGSIFSSSSPKLNTIEARPPVLSGKTYKIKWPTVDAAFYVTINSSLSGKPFEIFIASKSAKYAEWTTALSRMITAIFRRGGDISFVSKELKEVISATDTGWIDGKYFGSLVAMIGSIIDGHLNGKDVRIQQKGSICPQCSSPTLIKKEGCLSCTSCTYSTCS